MASEVTGKGYLNPIVIGVLIAWAFLTVSLSIGGFFVDRTEFEVLRRKAAKVEAKRRRRVLRKKGPKVLEKQQDVRKFWLKLVKEKLTNREAKPREKMQPNIRDDQLLKDSLPPFVTNNPTLGFYFKSLIPRHRWFGLYIYSRRDPRWRRTLMMSSIIAVHMVNALLSIYLFQRYWTPKCNFSEQDKCESYDRWYLLKKYSRVLGLDHFANADSSSPCRWDESTNECLNLVITAINIKTVIVLGSIQQIANGFCENILRYCYQVLLSPTLDTTKRRVDDVEVTKILSSYKTTITKQRREITQLIVNYYKIMQKFVENLKLPLDWSDKFLYGVRKDISEDRISYLCSYLYEFDSKYDINKGGAFNKKVCLLESRRDKELRFKIIADIVHKQELVSLLRSTNNIIEKEKILLECSRCDLLEKSSLLLYKSCATNFDHPYAQVTVGIKGVALLIIGAYMMSCGVFLKDLEYMFQGDTVWNLWLLILIFGILIEVFLHEPFRLLAFYHFLPKLLKESLGESIDQGRKEEFFFENLLPPGPAYIVATERADLRACRIIKDTFEIPKQKSIQYGNDDDPIEFFDKINAVFDAKYRPKPEVHVSGRRGLTRFFSLLLFKSLQWNGTVVSECLLHVLLPVLNVAAVLFILLNVEISNDLHVRLLSIKFTIPCFKLVAYILGSVFVPMLGIVFIFTCSAVASEKVRDQVNRKLLVFRFTKNLGIGKSVSRHLRNHRIQALVAPEVESDKKKKKDIDKNRDGDSKSNEQQEQRVEVEVEVKVEVEEEKEVEAEPALDPVVADEYDDDSEYTFESYESDASVDDKK